MLIIAFRVNTQLKLKEKFVLEANKTLDVGVILGNSRTVNEQNYNYKIIRINVMALISHYVHTIKILLQKKEAASLVLLCIGFSVFVFFRRVEEMSSEET